MIETVVIRAEQLCDFDEIRTVVKTAFAAAEHTDGDEHNLVDRLRCTEEYIPELSFVAEIKGKIVGYAMFSQINIGISKAIALAPLAVLPGFQNQGIGRALIEAGHLKAKEGDYYCSVVLGSPEYYSKSGYLSALPLGLKHRLRYRHNFIWSFRLNANYHMVQSDIHKHLEYSFEI